MPDDATRRAAEAPVTTADSHAPAAEDDLSLGLSDAARGVIRQSADPRLDAHLARMLSDAPAQPRPRESDAPGGRLADLAAELESAQRVVRILAWLLVIAVATIVLLLVLLLVR